MRQRLDCWSILCVYLKTCARCGAHYSGSSTEHMHMRHGGHRAEGRGESSPLGIHLARCCQDNPDNQDNSDN